MHGVCSVRPFLKGRLLSHFINDKIGYLDPGAVQPVALASLLAAAVGWLWADGILGDPRQG